MVFWLLEVGWVVALGVAYEAARQRWSVTGYRQLVARVPSAARGVRIAYQLIIAAVWWWGLIMLDTVSDADRVLFLILMQPQWSALYRSLRWHVSGKPQAARQAAQAATQTQQIARATADLLAVGVLVTQVAPDRYTLCAPMRALPSVTGLKTVDELIATAALVRTAQVLHELCGTSQSVWGGGLGSPPHDASRN